MKRSDIHADQWHDNIPCAPLARRLAPGTRILCIGSCFAQMVGERLATAGMRVETNPFGTLYNPSSIALALERIRDSKPYSKNELFEHDGLWRSFDHDTSFARPAPSVTLRYINGQLRKAHECWNALDAIVVTFGTAWEWRLTRNNRTVANCHRMDQRGFKRDIDTLEHITGRWRTLLSTIYEQHPGVRIILSVSPVRYTRDTPHGNAVGKAYLIAAAHELEKSFPQLHYFPAYEIVLDELRDYRFFARDRAHLSDEAREYIWKRFSESCLDPPAQALADTRAHLAACMTHRPSTSGQATASFARAQLSTIDRLEREYPQTALTTERRYFERLLKRCR